ncbi:histone H3-like [Sorex araneus]|uniref:histone H3-like n=1 Tax=Sorex araneus TaxID=42254 RepID=UPI00243391CB|nr:histone H3-like [Sorex araneus]
MPTAVAKTVLISLTLKESPAELGRTRGLLLSRRRAQVSEPEGALQAAGTKTACQSEPGRGSVKKPPWYRPNTMALREIAAIRGPQSCLFSSCHSKGWCARLHRTSRPTMVLQECETDLLGLFQDTNFCDIQVKHITIILKDNQLVCRLRGERA